MAVVALAPCLWVRAASPATPACGPLPLDLLQKQKGSDYVNPRQGSFLPPSLASFSWPIDVWDLVVG